MQRKLFGTVSLRSYASSVLPVMRDGRDSATALGLRIKSLEEDADIQGFSTMQ